MDALLPEFRLHWKLYLALVVVVSSVWYSLESSSESAEYIREKQTNYASTPTEFMLVEELKTSAGDLLECERYWGLYDHWGVSIGNDEVIHLTTVLSHDQNKDQIRKDSKADFSRGSRCRINNLELAASARNLKARTKQEIVLTAFDHLEEYESGTWNRNNKYSLLEFNCQHFATYVRFGTPFSEMAQILDDKPIVKKMAQVLDSSS